jgi:hypothetical protein
MQKNNNFAFGCLFNVSRSQLTLTTIPPEDPPQAARDPIGVRLALSFRSMMIGWPFSIRIF